MKEEIVEGDDLELKKPEIMFEDDPKDLFLETETENPVALISHTVDVVEEDANKRISEENWLQTIQDEGDLDKIESLIVKWAGTVERFRRMAINTTNPEDWVLFKKSKDDDILESSALLTASGCRRVGQLFGIKIMNKRPVDAKTGFAPEKAEDGNGNTTLTMWADGFSPANGQRVENLEVTINAAEDFTGRKFEGDLRAALQTRADSKIVRILTGLINVPARDLTAEWSNGKTLERCHKGAGFGSSKARSAQKTKEKGVGARAEELWAEIVRVMSDDEAARQVLKECTRFKRADGSVFNGIDNHQRFGKLSAVEIATKRWAEHEMNPQSKNYQGA